MRIKAGESYGEFMIVLIDTREQAPLQITAYPVEKAGLPVGDYGLKGFSDWTNPQFICERKSIGDLCGSLTAGRDRFTKEIEKMRQFGFRALLIEGSRHDICNGSYRSSVRPQSILASLDALAVRCNLHVFWCGDADGAARQFEGLVRQFARGIEKQYKLLSGDKKEDKQ